MDEPADPGLFGPESVTWRLHGHVSALVGGLRALLVQTLHPLAMAGVAQHSNYRQDPLGRFRRTAEFVAATTYGTTAEAGRAIAIVRAVHQHIAGVAPDGRSYRADDPALLSWVHNVEVESIACAYRRFGPGLSRSDANRYVQEMTRVALAVGADDLPETYGDLRRWVAQHPERKVTADARRTARFLLLPPLPKLMLAPYGVLMGSALSLMSVRERVALRLPTVPPAEPLLLVPAARVLLAGLGVAIGQSPPYEAALARVGVG